MEIESVRIKLQKMSQDMDKLKLMRKRLVEDSPLSRERSADIVANFLEHIFIKSVVSMNEFVVRALTCPSCSFLVCVVDSIVLPLTQDLDVKMRNKIYKMPLNYVCQVEQARVPHAIESLCAAIDEISGREDFEAEMALTPIEEEEEVRCSEALVVSFDFGYAAQTDLKEVTLPVLVVTLNALLKHLPAPLLTWSFSNLLVEHFGEKNSFMSTAKTFKQLLQCIPLCYLNTIVRVVTTLSKLCQSKDQVTVQISKFFTPCFVRVEKEAKKLTQIATLWILTNGPRVFPTLKTTEMALKSHSILCPALSNFVEQTDNSFEEILYSASSSNDISIFRGREDRVIPENSDKY